MPLANKRIAIVGAGNMGEALLRGLLDSGAIAPSQVVAADADPSRLELLGSRLGVDVSRDNAAAARGADIVLLAVKPQQIAGVLAGLREAVSPEKLVISVAAGVQTSRVERGLRDRARVVRVMPNTPAQIREGVAVLCKGRYATDEDLAIAEAILGAVGTTASTDEGLMDAVTALSGSGPAYVFLVAEAMIEAGVRLGLDEELAGKLALRTMLGAAKLMVRSGERPADLRRKVTSRGGTTEAAIRVLTDGRLVELFADAVRAAADRSRELSSG